LTADHNRIKANRNDLAFVKIEVIDENSRLVPQDSIPIKLIFSGNGELAASANANPKDMASVNQPNLRNLQSVKRPF
jgi:beta-galactosidase